MSAPVVVAVVVSHERRELLAECLDAVGGQTRPVDRVVVVDNASADGSPALVRQRFPAVDLVALERNTGGAGGFAAGMARAVVRHDADLVWLMDDDTIPRPDALAELLGCRSRHDGAPALVASRVVWHDGRDHPMNTPRRRPGATAEDIDAAGRAGAVPVRSASFVSVLVDAAALRVIGLPVADYFIWNDDFEFTTRLLRDHVGLASTLSTVEHRTRTFGTTDADPGERFFYEVRNKVWLFGRSPGLRPGERLLYAGSTARRWVRTLVRSRHRRVLLSAGARGLAEGLRRGPRTTTDLLADLPEVAADVRAVDRRTRR